MEPKEPGNEPDIQNPMRKTLERWGMGQSQLEVIVENAISELHEMCTTFTLSKEQIEIELKKAEERSRAGEDEVEENIDDAMSEQFVAFMYGALAACETLLPELKRRNDGKLYNNLREEVVNSFTLIVQNVIHVINKNVQMWTRWNTENISVRMADVKACKNVLIPAMEALDLKDLVFELNGALMKVEMKSVYDGPISQEKK